MTHHLGVLLAAAVLAAGCTGDDASAPSTTTVTPTTQAGTAVDDLAPGDCLLDVSGRSAARVETVGCRAEHRGEVYAIHELTDGSFPGPVLIREDAALGCADLYEDYAGEPIDPTTDRAFTELVPSQGTWAEGDRTVVCLALASGGGTAPGSIAADAP